MKLNLKFKFYLPFCSLIILLVTSVASASIPVKVAVGPDSNLDVLLDVIGSPKKELVINVYQFENEMIAKAVIEQIKAKKAVKILIEGNPFRGLTQNGKRIISLLQKAMKSVDCTDCRLYLMRDPLKNSGWKNRRYRFNHAKYVVVDQTVALVSSENFSNSGHAKPGTKGNRGWDIAIKDPKLANELLTVFNKDANPKQKDILQLFPNETTLSTLSPEPLEPPIKRKEKPFPAKVLPADRVHLITAPLSTDALVKLILSAKRSLEVEYMSLPPLWANPQSQTNPIILAILQAAQKGVNTRILLNDETVFKGFEGGPNNAPRTPPKLEEEPKPKNLQTAEYLENVAECKKLPIQAKIVDVDALEITYIHNKGFLVDGVRTLVSSINGTQNSNVNNREVAVLVDGPQVNAYYRDVFDYDWKNSPELKIKPKCGKGMNIHAFTGLSSFFTP